MRSEYRIIDGKVFRKSKELDERDDHNPRVLSHEIREVRERSYCKSMHYTSFPASILRHYNRKWNTKR